MGDVTEPELAPELALDSVAFDELNGPDTRALLDTIDSLRELQVGEIVNLPQIIVVGDQSSGKSSVLEAISRVRFPIKGDLCTRFATELVLRRAPETKIDVRIDWAAMPGSGSSRRFHRTSFHKDDLPEIISEAMGYMGIRAGSTKGFSRDTLRVEIVDPDIYPVTLVDLPGFFHSETSDQTQEGKEIVDKLAEDYMKQPKSLILAVVSANQNLAIQIVAEEARKHDPNRERTLGVITKPDLAGPGSQNEKNYLELVRGQEPMHRLKLGWHVLRNRPEGHEKMSADGRDAEEEKFFQTGAWSGISPTSCGVTHLRKKLSKVLLGHIQRTLPGLIAEIESKLSIRERTLRQLGKPRSEPDELRIYLLEIAERFQRLSRDGAEGRYGDEFFGGLYHDYGPRKLRAFLRRLNRAFYTTLRTKGVARQIEWDDEEFQFDYGGLDSIQNGDDVAVYLRPFLDLFGGFREPPTISESKLCKELEKLAAANQGTEFPGLPNGNLAFQFFKMQAVPWGGIAQFYLDRVVDFAKSFVKDLFTHIIGADKQTADAILAFCVHEFFEDKRRALKEKLQELLRPYASAYGPPLDAEFYAALSSRTIRQEAERDASLLEEKFPASFTNQGGRCLTHEKVAGVISNAKKARASEFGTEKVIEMAMTHFQISLRTFAENVVNLAVENCLISDIPTILTPSAVVRMDEERLKELASESDDIQMQREKLQREVKILTEGLEKCLETVRPEAFLNAPSSILG